MKNEHPLEYQMSRDMFNAMLKQRSEGEKKLNPYNYVMNVINEEWNLRGKVTRLSVT